jgi:hypothetical protein
MSDRTAAQVDRTPPRILKAADRPLRSDPLVWVSLIVAAIVASVLVASTYAGTGTATGGELCLAFGRERCVENPPSWLLGLFAWAVVTPLLVVVLGSARAFVRGYRGELDPGTPGDLMGEGRSPRCGALPWSRTP